MNELIKLVESNIISTINGLTGEEPSVTLISSEPIHSSDDLNAPFALTTIGVSGDTSAKAAILISANLASAVSDMMLGGEGDMKDALDEEDIDATKEIMSNIFGALSTEISAQSDIPKLNFTVEDTVFCESNSDADIAGYSFIYEFDATLQENSTKLYFLIDDNLTKLLNSDVQESTEEEASPVSKSVGKNDTEDVQLSDDELQNINLILDVKLPVRVRIGSKKILLKDVLTMDIGSVIELNQLANEPLDILIGDKMIARGEVVIVDGNFGVQVTEVISKRERLENLSS